MRNRKTVMLNWYQPPEWNRFLEKVSQENGGYTSPYAGIVIENSWKEFFEKDRAEELIDLLSRSAGHVYDGSPKKTFSRSTEFERSRAAVRIRPDIKNEMVTFANEHQVQYHEVLRAVINWYLEDGRLGRITRHLERILPEIRDLVEYIDENGEMVPVTRRRTIQICRHLDAEFTESDLRAAIHTVAGSSEQTIEKYTELVKKTRNVVKHPNSDQLYVPEAVRDEILYKREQQERKALEEEAKATFQQMSEAVTDGGKMNQEAESD